MAGWGWARVPRPAEAVQSSPTDTIVPYNPAQTSERQLVYPYTRGPASPTGPLRAALTHCRESAHRHGHLHGAAHTEVRHGVVGKGAARVVAGRAGGGPQRSQRAAVRERVQHGPGCGKAQAGGS